MSDRWKELRKHLDSITSNDIGAFVTLDVYVARGLLAERDELAAEVERLRAPAETAKRLLPLRDADVDLYELIPVCVDIIDALAALTEEDDRG